MYTCMYITQAAIQNEQKVLENKIEHIIMAFPT